MHHVFIQGAPNLHGVFIFTSILNRGWASEGEIMGNSALDGVSLTLEGPHHG